MSLKQYDELLEYYDRMGKQNDEEAYKITREADAILTRCEGFYAVNTEERPEKILISLTSIPERLEYVIYPVQCMLIQTMRPDQIILWLDEQRVHDEMLPQRLLELRKYGLKICYVEDIGPHTKYYYAMQRYSEAVVITIDDDLLYQRTLIEGLMESHEKNPSCVCAYWVWKMKFSIHGIPYMSSGYGIGMETDNDVPRNDFAALGFGGVLYPPDSVDHRAFDKEKIRKLALKADDVWLKAMEVLHGTRVVKTPGRHQYPHIYHSQTVALQHENVSGNNDIVIKNVFLHYELTEFFQGYPKLENDKAAILFNWVSAYQNGKKIGKYLCRKGIHTVAIYGMGMLGRLVVQELAESNIRVLYGIDQNAGRVPTMGLVVVGLEEAKMNVDLVIVTASVCYQELSIYLKSDMLSVEDLLEEMVFDEISV